LQAQKYTQSEAVIMIFITAYDDRYHGYRIKPKADPAGCRFICLGVLKGKSNCHFIPFLKIMNGLFSPAFFPEL
jgi:hypothetical protein